MSTSADLPTSGAESKTSITKELLQSRIDLGIWYTLFNWPILTTAIQNHWGGPESSDKRDWLAGAISEIFDSNPDTDAVDVEVVLLQALEDEFGVRLEDETEVQVAADVVRIRGECLDGEFGSVEALERRWKERKGKEVSTGSVVVQEREQEGEWDSVDEESDEGDEDVEMGEAPAPAPVKKEKPAPIVDEDGFEKVVGKKRR